MSEVDRTVDHMKDEAANFPDPADRATQEEEFSLELRTRDRERKLIKKIDDTLSLMKTGEYGYWETCGVEIGLRRMEARPTATQCIDCKSLDEIKEKLQTLLNTSNEFTVPMSGTGSSGMEAWMMVFRATWRPV